MKKRTQFTCPNCGSHHFGSAMTSAGKYFRSCHGCYRFTWTDKDDAKYFHPTGVFEPTTGIGMLSTLSKA